MNLCVTKEEALELVKLREEEPDIATKLCNVGRYIQGNIQRGIVSLSLEQYPERLLREIEKAGFKLTLNLKKDSVVDVLWPNINAFEYTIWFSMLERRKTLFPLTVTEAFAIAALENRSLLHDILASACYVQSMMTGIAVKPKLGCKMIPLIVSGTLRMSALMGFHNINSIPITGIEESDTEVEMVFKENGFDVSKKDNKMIVSWE